MLVQKTTNQQQRELRTVDLTQSATKNTFTASFAHTAEHDLMEPFPAFRVITGRET